MKYPVDLSLFDVAAHSPTLPSLERSMRRPDLSLKDYCIPVNSYFPTGRMLDGFRSKLEFVLKYYPSSNDALAEVLGRFLGIDPDALVAANGSTELITWVDRLFVRDSLATPVPTFGRWIDQPVETGKRVLPFELRACEDFRLDVEEFAEFVHARGARVAAICNPNNPTGALLPADQVVRLLDLLDDLDLVIVDESFIDFADPGRIPTVAPIAAVRANVLVLKSLGKNFGLHGIRLGYGVAHPLRAHALREALPRWNVNAVAEMVLREVAESPEEYERSRGPAIRDRRVLEDALRGVEGLRVFPSRANFVYVRIPDEVDGVALRNRLLTEYGCLVRECGNKLGSDSHDFRIAARPRDRIAPLTAALQESLAELAGVAAR